MSSLHLEQGPSRRPRARVDRAAWLSGLAVFAVSAHAAAWDPLPVESDPLVRLPGTQPADGVVLDAPDSCMGCHGSYDAAIEPGANWQGSMMGQAARDPLFWAAVTVAAQDSIWAIGRPNAADLCLRCHTPTGWLGGRSDPPSGTQLSGADFDGVTCTGCHRQYDPFFELSATGARESADWSGYWDESELSSTPSSAAAAATLLADRAEASSVTLFNGNAGFDANYDPSLAGWTENGGGQYFASSVAEERASFADANATHAARYSRYHKSRYFCQSCHDVSNPVLANLAFDGTAPGDGTTELPSEQQPAFAYGHIERTFSEFMLSDYGQSGGADGLGPFAPASFVTSHPGNRIATCQDCHMPDAQGAAASLPLAVVRPTDSSEHSASGQPVHDFTGGNAWVPWLLASTVSSSPNHDPTNESLLGQGSALLTLDLTQGLALDADRLLAASDRAIANLQQAAAITALALDGSAGTVRFRIQNHTGHKLLSGFPEGRRMFVNIRAYQEGALVHEINPYDDTASTLRGLDPGYSPNSPALGAGEEHRDELVYEVSFSSSLTGESHTFHVALATDRYKDNRIPPQGFRIGEASARLVEPVISGQPEVDHFTAAEYAGGYDEVLVTLPSADGVEVRLYYQTTSREYVEFLRDEIDGTASTLASPTPSGEPQAYVIQTDGFFSQLAAWGDTLWQLWDHNRAVPGAAPVLMAYAADGQVPTPCDMPGSEGQPCDDGDDCTSTDTCTAGVCVGSDPVACAASDECHETGVCDPATGQCADPAAPDGTTCAAGSCVNGICEPAGQGGSPPAAMPAEDDGGCDCRLGRVPRGPIVPLGVAILSVLGVLRRTRRSASRSS